MAYLHVTTSINGIKIWKKDFRVLSCVEKCILLTYTLKRELFLNKSRSLGNTFIP